MTNSILDSVFGTLFFLIRTQTTRTKQNKKRTFFDISVPTNPLLVRIHWFYGDDCSWSSLGHSGAVDVKRVTTLVSRRHAPRFVRFRGQPEVFFSNSQIPCHSVSWIHLLDNPKRYSMLRETIKFSLAESETVHDSDDIWSTSLMKRKESEMSIQLFQFWGLSKCNVDLNDLEALSPALSMLFFRATSWWGQSMTTIACVFNESVNFLFALLSSLRWKSYRVHHVPPTHHLRCLQRRCHKSWIGWETRLYWRPTYFLIYCRRYPQI